MSFLVNSRSPSLVHFSKKDLERLLGNTLCFDSELTRHSFSLGTREFFSNPETQTLRARGILPYSFIIPDKLRIKDCRLLKPPCFIFLLLYFFFLFFSLFFLPRSKLLPKVIPTRHYTSQSTERTRDMNMIGKHDVKKGTALRAKRNNRQNLKLMV